MILVVCGGSDAVLVTLPKALRRMGCVVLFPIPVTLTLLGIPII